MRTISEIIKDAGGARVIADASDGAIQRDAVYKWPGSGIPDRHWSVLIDLAGATPDELYEANRAVREAGPPDEVPRPSRRAEAGEPSRTSALTEGAA